MITGGLIGFGWCFNRLAGQFDHWVVYEPSVEKGDAADILNMRTCQLGLEILFFGFAVIRAWTP